VLSNIERIQDPELIPNEEVDEVDENGPWSVKAFKEKAKGRVQLEMKQKR
jgi:hypothetical protein